jgi:hypothetical protein
MTGNIKVGMKKGINSAKWVLVFITQRYIEKIESEDMKVRNDLVAKYPLYI